MINKKGVDELYYDRNKKKLIAVDKKKIINTKRLHNKHIALAVPTRREAHLLRIE